MDPNLEKVSNEVVNASTPTQMVSATPATPPTPTPKDQPQKSKGLLATTIVLAILAIVGIGGAVYFYLDASNKATTNSELRAKIDLLETETGAEFIETTNNGTTITTVNVPGSGSSEVKSIVQKVYQAVSSNISNGRFETVFNDGSIIKIPGSTIYASSNESYGVVSWGSFYDSNVENDVMTNAHIYAEKVLTDNGFTEDKELMSSKLFYNSDDGIYCNVSERSFPFYAYCSKDTWISDENKELALILAEAADASYVFADVSKITDSTISPYQKLTASGLGAMMLFYRVSPDADWQFFTGTQAPLPCSEYIGDIAKAFAGDICYDESTGENLKVQP